MPLLVTLQHLHHNLPTRMQRISLVIAALLLLAATASANPQNVITPPSSDSTMIQAEGSAQAKVQNDFLSIELVFEKDDVNLSQLNKIMNKEATVALEKAAEKPAVSAKTSGFNIYPVYARERVLLHHHATYHISLETKDFEAGLSLAGDMQPFQVRNLSFSVSPEQRKATEKTLLEHAIADLRDNLTIAANSLGAKNVTIVNLTIGNRQYSPVQPRMMSDAITMERSTPVAAEAGESQIVLSVTGSAFAN